MARCAQQHQSWRNAARGRAAIFSRRTPQTGWLVNRGVAKDRQGASKHRRTSGDAPSQPRGIPIYHDGPARPGDGLQWGVSFRRPIPGRIQEQRRLLGHDRPADRELSQDRPAGLELCACGRRTGGKKRYSR
ncbi:MAG: hypothetical protein ABGZ19_14850 [Verrucomicrobiales bacterium]